VVDLCKESICVWMDMITAAGNAFIQSAEIHSKAGNRHEAATQFIDAANCYKKTDVNGENQSDCLQLFAEPCLNVFGKFLF